MRSKQRLPILILLLGVIFLLTVGLTTTDQNEIKIMEHRTNANVTSWIHCDLETRIGHLADRAILNRIADKKVEENDDLAVQAIKPCLE